MSRVVRQAGFTLVELMVSMLLGIVVVGGVISVLLANRNSYRSTEALSQMQESARTSFELMARDIRQTGTSGCDGARTDMDRRMSNMLLAPGAWWRNWESLRAYDESQTDPAVAFGTALGTRVAGTDSLHMHGIEGTGIAIQSHNTAGATFTLQTVGTFDIGDILMVCDFDHSAIFQNNSPPGLIVSLVQGGSSLNCSTGLGFAPDCSSSTGNVYMFPQNSWIGRLNATVWYIGNNNRPEDGGRSLFRVRLGANGAVVTEEVVAGVTDLQLRFSRLSANDVVVPSAITNATQWSEVNAAFVTMRVTSSSARVSSNEVVDQGRLSRPFTYVVAMRNRVP